MNKMTVGFGDLVHLWFAAKRNDVNAQARLAALYFDKKSNRLNYRKARYWADKAAKNGDHYSHRILGVLFHHGWGGVGRNTQKSLHHLTIAAREGGVVSAYRDLAVFYLDIGKTSESFKSIEQAAIQGDVRAMVLIGSETKYNLDCKSRIYWLSEAKKLGGYKGWELSHLGSMYMEGDCFEKDVSKAISLYKEADSRGSYFAAVNLSGVYLRDFGEGVDLDMAEYYCHRAIDREDQAPFASGTPYNHLGRIYFRRKSYLSARRFFREAIERGDEESVTNMAMTYFAERNFKDALGWYEKGKDLGHHTACYDLGRMYFYGLSVDENKYIASNYLELAVKLGSSSAKAFIEKEYDNESRTLVLSRLENLPSCPHCGTPDANRRQCEDCGLVFCTNCGFPTGLRCPSCHTDSSRPLP